MTSFHVTENQGSGATLSFELDSVNVSPIDVQVCERICSQEKGVLQSTGNQTEVWSWLKFV